VEESETKEENVPPQAEIENKVEDEVDAKIEN